MLLSRRSILLGDSYPQKPARLALYLPNDPEFRAHVEKAYPGLLESDAFRRMQHLIVLIKNQSTAKLNAYSIHWNMTDPLSGSKHQVRQEFFTRHCMPTRTVRSVQPGQIRLMSPLFNLSPAEYTNGQPEQLGLPIFDDSLAATQQVSVIVDSAVYADGHAFGPDLSRLRKRYVALRHGEHDEAHSLHKFIAQMRTPLDEKTIVDFLQAHVNMGLTQTGEYAKSHYWQARGREAQRLQDRLSRGGLEHLANCVKRRRRYGREWFHVVRTKATA